jgi:hypothetical protein
LAAEDVPTKPKKRTQSTSVKKKNKRVKVPAHTVQSVLDDFAETTEYGKTFRGLSTEKQQAEVDVLNKGAAKGLRGLVKNTMLDKQFTELIGEKMRQFFIDTRVSQASMIRSAPKSCMSVTSNVKFLSAGEWVEIDADRSPGFNSEGGIAVIISVHDDMADVKYVLTRRVEKLIPLRRLTVILMPHRGPRASLRQQKKPAASPANNKGSGSQSDFRMMSAVQILKHGLESNLWKKKGWLFDLLHREGLLESTKQARKETCWSYYKSQQLYIEALQEAKNDPEYDPRRNEHMVGKDGKFVQKKNASLKPKNPLTVTYLCFALDIPYPTFKRWKSEAFVTKKFVPEHKGKSVLTDKKFAGQIYNPRKMFVMNEMEKWLNKHPAKKYDTQAKKVCDLHNIVLLICLRITYVHIDNHL